MPAPPPVPDVAAPPAAARLRPWERGPAGTVPVLRLDVDSVIDNLFPPATLEEYLASLRKVPAPGSGSDHHYAYSGQQIIDGIYGGDGYLSVPDVYVWKNGEMSLGQVSCAADFFFGATWQTVESGWHKLPSLYGDWNMHWFIYFTTNGYDHVGHNEGGYNRVFAGWVQWDASFFPGRVMSGQSEWYLQVQRYQGNWWIWHSGCGCWVGYYPSSLFHEEGLQKPADRLGYPFRGGVERVIRVVRMGRA